ncbi:MAG: response regulator [Desulfobacteraceae bacterium]|nr:MAG: response regulator [Desulfobacteraceae bacterium]
MKRILIAIEEEAMAVFLTEELMEEAYEVILCSDALSLVREIRRTRPHLILMDEKFGGNQRAILHRNISAYLKNTPFIILWRGNRPSCSRSSTGPEGFALGGFNLSNLKRRIERILDEGILPPVPEIQYAFRVPLIQTEFHWVKAE